jgi:uncharacterized protein YqeY
MTKQTQINEDIKQAMRERNQSRLDVLRQLKTAITNAAILSGNVNNPLTDNEVISVIRKQISQREDSIKSYISGNRSDLVDKENQEITFLTNYLPAALSNDEIDELVQVAMNDTQAVSRKDMGKVIKRAAELADGRVDNKTISMKIAQLLK